MSTAQLILVTGGAGFIGSHTVLELLQAGYEVVVVDNFSNSVASTDGGAVSLNRVKELSGKSFSFFELDVCDYQAMVNLFNKFIFDGVVHFAALKAVAESCKMPLEYYSTNINGCLTVLKVCRQFGVKNFIFSSSATVYGPPQYLPLTEDHPIGHGLTNPYGRSKCMQEQILADLSLADKEWNIILLRYFNPVGAHPSGKIGEDPKGIPNNLMPYVSQVAIGKLPFLHVYGNDYNTIDGTGVRDYIHIVDLARGHLAAFKKIEEGNIGCKVYNLGTGNGYSVMQMADALEKASGKKIERKIEGRRTGDLANVYCDPKLAAIELHWKAEFGLEDMCRDLWNWQSQNPNGFRS